jgi:hypothetical protein
MTSPRQRIQKRAVTPETQKKRTLRRDLHTDRPEPASGREFTKRGQNTTEHRKIKKRRLEANAQSKKH